MSSHEVKIAEIEERRTARRAALETQRLEQLATDLEALDALEEENGNTNLARLDVPFTPGLPTMAVVRLPTPTEMKRYKDRLRKARKDNKDTVAATDELATTCIVYPPRDVYEQLLQARSGIHTQLGALAANLAAGEEHEEGKD